jgi:hypothetical protein
MALQILCERQGGMWTASVFGTLDARDYVQALETLSGAPAQPVAVPDTVLARERDLPAVMQSVQRQAREGEVRADTLGAFVFWRAVSRVARATAAWSERRINVEND